MPPAGNSLSGTCLPSIAPTVHGLDFHIESGKRAGVVAPTGSGRSSLALVPLRCIPTEGNVLHDGIPTSKINPDALRTNVTIISLVLKSPSSTLRGNSDSFGQRGGAALNNAHWGAGLFSIQSEGGEGRTTLEATISSEGGSLLISQRHIWHLPGPSPVAVSF